MLFDNSLNDKRFRIDIRVENGYEEGCTRGATSTLRGPSQQPRSVSDRGCQFHPGVPR